MNAITLIPPTAARTRIGGGRRPLTEFLVAVGLAVAILLGFSATAQAASAPGTGPIGRVWQAKVTCGDEEYARGAGYPYPVRYYQRTVAIYPPTMDAAPVPLGYKNIQVVSFQAELQVNQKGTSNWSLVGRSPEYVSVSTYPWPGGGSPYHPDYDGWWLDTSVTPNQWRAFGGNPVITWNVPIPALYRVVYLYKWYANALVTAGSINQLPNADAINMNGHVWQYRQYDQNTIKKIPNSPNQPDCAGGTFSSY